MICKHAIRDTMSDGGRYYLICILTKSRCPLVRFCPTKNDIINIDNIEQKCNIYKHKGASVMSNGQYKVLFEKRGLLYVELDSNTVIQIKNQLQTVPQSVDLIKVKNEYYIKGYEPKIVVEKKEFNKKQNKE